MPQTPNERIATLQREYEASQQRLADINRNQAERERQWAIEDAARREEDELARRARKAQKELDRKEREGRKKEKLRSGKAPPRDKDPPIFGGNNKPKKTRYVSLPSLWSFIRSLVLSPRYDFSGQRLILVVRAAEDPESAV